MLSREGRARGMQEHVINDFPFFSLPLAIFRILTQGGREKTETENENGAFFFPSDETSRASKRNETPARSLARLHRWLFSSPFRFDQ